MAALMSMASLAFAGAAFALPGSSGLKAMRQITDANVTTVSNVTLTPITLPPDAAPTGLDSIVPQPNITLNYGLDNSSATVNVTLITNYDGVLLEAIANLSTVDCSSDSVSITFTNAAYLAAAHTSWSSYDKLLLVTNHVGDCDSEFDRGFFVSSTFQSFESNLTLIAGVQKVNVSDITSHMRANFTGIPAAATNTPSTKRDIVLDSGDVTVSADWAFGPLTLYEYENYFTATANSATVGVSVTLSGYLDFNVWGLALEDLYVDVETSTYADLSLELNVTAPYDNTWSYAIGYEYYLVDVAGLLTFGPEISLSVGADLAVEGAVDVILDIGAEIENGTLHLDLIGDSTAAAGWVPTYHANLTLSEEASIEVSPFLTVGIELEFEVLGGLLDLSSGLTPKVSFPVNVTLDAEQDIDVGTSTNDTVTISQPTDGTCKNGVEVVSDFEFTLDAFVTEYWSDTLYSITIPIADECYSWA